MRPNGICVVYLGLLGYTQNEAQLAAVLSHEITHAAYEHGASDNKNRRAAAKRQGKINHTATEVSRAIVKFKPSFSSKDKKGRTVFNKQVKPETADLFLKDLPGAKLMKYVADYSVNEEAQADRVGLWMMVNAGYDPREAAIFWKNVFNQSGGDQPDESDAKKRNDSKDPLLQKGDMVDFGTAYLKNAMERKVDKAKEKSKRDHPEDIDRFKAINELVGTYYSTPQLLAGLKTGETEYSGVMSRFETEYKAVLKKQQEEARKEQARRPQVAKQMQAAMPKVKAKLAGLTKSVYAYKGYDLKAVFNIAQLTSGSKIAKADIK